MRDTTFTDANGPNAHPATRAAKNGIEIARPTHPGTSVRPDCRNCLLRDIQLGPFWAWTMELPKFLLSRASSESANATFGTEGRTANIVLEGAANRCKQMIFDNDTGRIVESNKPCDKDVTLDEKGMPIPQGTVRRLGAISKSFSKQ